jgi:phage tail-like protein
VRLLNLAADAHPEGHRIDLTWENPDIARTVGVQVVRRTGRYPERPDDGHVLMSGPDTGAASDTGLRGETVYYYSLFLDEGAGYKLDAHNRVAALATTPYGLGGQMFDMLPALYHRYDALQNGSLRNFLDVPGALFDQFQSYARSLLETRNVETVDGRLLPLLAQWIGWKTNFRADFDTQRNDIRHAPELYGTVGVLANLRAIVNRFTNWDSQIKEFFHNVYLTNSPERLTLWSRPLSASSGVASDLVTLEYAYEGAPAVQVDRLGRSWLFFHYRRDEDWRLAYKTREVGQPWSAACLLPRTAGIQKYPAVVEMDRGDLWLFWSACVADAWSIRSCRLATGRGANPAQLTGDRSGPFTVAAGTKLVLSVNGTDAQTVTFPAMAAIQDIVNLVNRTLVGVSASVTAGGALQLSSQTAGPGSQLVLDVDASTAAASLGFGAALPAGTTPGRQAVVMRDAGSGVWLLWSAQTANGTNIRARNFDGTTWGPDIPVTSGPADAEPAVTAAPGAGAGLWLFFSRRDGTGWKTCYLTKPDRSAANNWNAAVTEVAPIGGADNREPSAARDAQGNVVVAFGSNRSGAWNVWWSRFDVATSSWSETEAATTGYLTQRAPALYADAGQTLQLVFRSCESVAYASGVYPGTTSYDYRYAGSTTVDVANRTRNAKHGQWKDTLGYSYDTGKQNHNWYARDTVGVFLTPDSEDQQLQLRAQELIRGLLAAFLPIQLRVVFIINPSVVNEAVYTYEFPAIDPPRVIGEVAYDSTLPETYAGARDRYTDRVPGWVWMRSWNTVYRDHHAVNFAAAPIDLRYRTWHIAITPGG